MQDKPSKQPGDLVLGLLVFWAEVVQRNQRLAVRYWRAGERKSDFGRRAQMRYVLCMAICLGAHTGRAADIAIEMKPITETVRPGLTAVVEVSAINRSDRVAEVSDLYWGPYSTWSWSWTWNDGNDVQAIREEDVLDIVPESIIPPMVKLAAGERVTWFVVVPAPEKLSGHKSASLRIGYFSEGKEIAESSCTFKVGKPFVLTNKAIKADWVRKTLATGSGGNADSRLKDQKSYSKRWSGETDGAFLLGWFCIKLELHEFDERAWNLLQAEAEDFRAIRNARLDCALYHARLRLLKYEAQTMIKNLPGDDPLSKSLRKRLGAVK
jgi:hypothetical protein